MRVEIMKFGTVGAITFCLDSAILYVVDVTFHEPIIAKIIAAVIAATAAFLGNRYWTWRHRPHTSLAREYGRYAVANGAGLGIQLACLGIAHYGLGAIWPEVFQTVLAHMISANVVGMAIATTFRFWTYRTFVFKAAAPQPVAMASQPGRD